MSVKVLLVVCAQVFLIKAVFSQCIGLNLNTGAFERAEGPLPTLAVKNINLLASRSPAFPPIGVTVISDNLIADGVVDVRGSLPFLGTVLAEGVVPSSGQGAVYAEGGTGDVGILSEKSQSLVASNAGLNGLAGLGRIGGCGQL